MGRQSSARRSRAYVQSMPIERTSAQNRSSNLRAYKRTAGLIDQVLNRRPKLARAFQTFINNLNLGTLIAAPVFDHFDFQAHTQMGFDTAVEAISKRGYVCLLTCLEIPGELAPKDIFGTTTPIRHSIALGHPSRKGEQQGKRSVVLDHIGFVLGPGDSGKFEKLWEKLAERPDIGRREQAEIKGQIVRKITFPIKVIGSSLLSNLGIRTIELLDKPPAG